MMMLSNANLSNWVHLCIYGHGHGHTLDFVIQHHPLIQMCSFQLPMHKDILDLVLNKIFLQRELLWWNINVNSTSLQNQSINSCKCGKYSEWLESLHQQCPELTKCYESTVCYYLNHLTSSLLGAVWSEILGDLFVTRTTNKVSLLG